MEKISLRKHIETLNKNQPSLKDLEKKKKEEDLKLLEEYVNDIEESYNIEAVKEEFVEIDIKTFENSLLPYLIGSVPRNEANYEIFLRNFLAITKDFVKELRIIDGDKVYYLPPLLYTKNNKLNIFNKINFNRVFEKIKIYRANGVNLKAKQLEEKFMNILEEELNNSNDFIEDKYKKSYLNLIRKYKLSSLKTEEKHKKSDLENLFEY